MRWSSRGTHTLTPLCKDTGDQVRVEERDGGPIWRDFVRLRWRSHLRPQGRARCIHLSGPRRAFDRTARLTRCRRPLSSQLHGLLGTWCDSRCEANGDQERWQPRRVSPQSKGPPGVTDHRPRHLDRGLEPRVVEPFPVGMLNRSNFLKLTTKRKVF